MHVRFSSWLRLLIGLFACFAPAAIAQDLDEAFDAEIRRFGAGRAIAIQPDGKVLVGGEFTLAGGGHPHGHLARFHADGAIDQEFRAAIGAGANGDVTGIALQPDGKIVIGGLFTEFDGNVANYVARLHPDGSFDSTFASGSGFNDAVSKLAVQTDGKIVVAGSFTNFNGTTRNRVARLNADGSLDTGFLNTGAAANGVVWDLKLQADGKVVIAGGFTAYNGTTRNRIARLNTNGTLDTGIAFTGGANSDIFSVAIDSAGRFVIGGQFTAYNGVSSNRIARLTTSGARDSSFAVGTGFGGGVLGVAVDSDDRVIAVGGFQSYNGSWGPDFDGLHGIARLLTNGAIDQDFVPAAGVHRFVRNQPLQVVVVGPNNSVLLGGSFSDSGEGRGGITRLTVTGARDAAFNVGDGLGLPPFAQARSGADGKYYVFGLFDWIGGQLRNNIARFLPDATIDPDFQPFNADFDNVVSEVVELANGQVWAFGPFTAVGAEARNGAARFDSSGALLAGSPGNLSVTGGYVYRALVESSGDLILVGTFTHVNGAARAGVARVTATGANGTGFSPGTGPTGGVVYDAALDSEGRILVAGSFTGFSGVAEPSLVRLSGSGDVDTSFAANTALDGPVFSVLALPEDQVLVGGSFTTSGGFVVNGIDRLNADGTSDPAFVPGTEAGDYVRGAAIDSAGRISLTGGFSVGEGEWTGLARLKPNGVRDPVFTSDRTAGELFGALALSDGKVLAGGWLTSVNGQSRLALARFHAEHDRRGGLVSANHATLANGTVRAIVPAPDGAFIVAGDFTMFSGTSRNRIVKVDTAGAIDPDFVYTSGFNSPVHGGFIEPDGKTVFWGAFANYNGAGASSLVRLLPDGSRDGSFIPPVFNSEVRAVVRLPDGKYVVAGAFTTAGVAPAGGLVRLNANGSLDSTFHAGTGANGAILALIHSPDGSLFAGGAFTSFAGSPAPGVVKLNPDGSRAGGFDIGTGVVNPAAPVRALLLQADGRLLAGGSFSSFNGVATGGLVRLETGGAVDESFLGGLGVMGSVGALGLMPDGRVYVGGTFTALGASERRGLARLNADGSIDARFDVGSGFDGDVLAAVSAEGRLAVGGAFTSVNGVPRNRFAVLYAADEDPPFVPDDAPSSFEVDPGHGFYISLGAPVAGMRYQWYRDGQLIPGATGSVYSVATAGLDDIGTYTVTISNGAGEYTTLGTTVIVRLPPEISSAPLPVSSGYGATATFTVAAIGPGPFSYQWFRGEEAIEGADDSSYSLTNVGDDDFGASFWVRITNAYGNVKSTPVILSFDPAAVPGALAPAFAAAMEPLPGPPAAFVRGPDGKYYIGGSGFLRRLNADGTTDTTFTPSFSSLNVEYIVAPADGGVIVAGSLTPTGGSSQRMVKLLPSGALDSAFTPPVFAPSHASLTAVVGQADGKILVAGNFTAVAGANRQYLARLNANGSVDTGFAPADNATGPNGLVRAIAIQGTNLVLAGDFTTYRNVAANRIVRVTTANAIDGSFGGGSRASDAIHHLLARPDGKLYIAGDFSSYNGVARNRFARLNANGSLDTGFDFGSGPDPININITPRIFGMALSDADSVVVIGEFAGFSGRLADRAIRLTSTGAPDTQWATWGATPPNIGTAFTRIFGQPGGELFVSGFMTIPGQPAVQNFGRLLGGAFPPKPPSIIAQPVNQPDPRPAGQRVSLSVLASGPGNLSFQWYRNGEPVEESPTVVRTTTSTLTFRTLRADEAGTYFLRVTSDEQGSRDSDVSQIVVQPEMAGPGSLDLTWAADPLPRSPQVLLRAPDGSTFVATDAFAGNSPFIFKFNSDGVLLPDSVFQTGSGFDGRIDGMALQSDGKLLVGGVFNFVQNVSRPYLARLHTDGSLDTAFSPAPNNQLTGITTQADGRILVTGHFTSIAGAGRNGIARFTATGSLDTGFVPGAHGLSWVYQAVVAPAGKVYIAGRNGATNTDDILRLNANGSLDGTFARLSFPAVSVRDFAVDSSGRLLVAGSFTSVGGQPAGRIARFDSSGVRDTSFGSSGSAGASTTLDRVLPGEDGYIYLMTGSSLTYDGFNLGPLVRLQEDGILDTSFPAVAAHRLSSTSNSRLEWIQGKLQVFGSFSASPRSRWIRLNVDGGPTGAPALVESSGNRTVVEGLAVALYARFSGSGPFTYEWRKDGVLIEGANAPQLLLGNTSAGSYTVTATNAEGSATATMEVHFFPPDPLSPTPGIDLSSSFNGAITQLIRLEDESILVGGSFTMASGTPSRGVARITPEGQLDTAFSGALPFSTSSTTWVGTLAVESDGRILVHGTLNMADNSIAYLVRLNADGTLANVLLNSSNTNPAPARMALQADGKILMAGNFTTIAGQPREGLARLLPNGTLDPAFQTVGLEPVHGVVALQMDGQGRPLLSGSLTSVGGASVSGQVVRLTDSGELDPGFTCPLAVSPRFYLSADGGIYAYQHTTLVRLQEDGRVDPRFSGTPGTSGSINAIGEDGFGRLFITTSNTLSRLLPNGLVDRTVPISSFGPVMAPAGDRLLVAGVNSINGIAVRGIAYVDPGPLETVAVVINSPSSVEVAEGGQLLLRAGIRGSEDATFQWFRDGEPVDGATGDTLVLDPATPGASGSYTLVVTGPSGEVTTAASQVTVHPNLGRPGEIDLEWAAGQDIAGVSSIERDPHGNLYLLGGVLINGAPARPVVAISPDGTERSDFTVSSRLSGSASHIDFLADGRLLLAGGSLLLDGLPAHVVLLMSDGSLDESFAPAVATHFQPLQFSVVRTLGDGRVLVFGAFSTFNGVSRQNLVRLNANGTLDTSFTETLGSPVAMVPAPEGRWWLVGRLGPSLQLWLSRLHADGTLDASFVSPALRMSPAESPSLAVATADGGFYAVITRFGASPRLVRVTPEGEVDPSFQPGTFLPRGLGSPASFSAMAVDDLSRLVLTGHLSSYDGVTRNGIVRLLSDGSADLSFVSPSALNIASTAGPSRVAIDGAGRIVLIGPAGFGGLEGRNVFALHSAEVPSETTPALTGTLSDFDVAPYDPLDIGLPVFAPADASVQWYRNGAPLPEETGARFRRIAAGADQAGMYYATITTAGGSISTSVASVTIRDTSYHGGLSSPNAATRIDTSPVASVKQPDGRILMVSSGSVVNGDGPFELFRLHADGSFASGLPTATNGGILAAAVDDEGRIYIGGNFTSVNGIARARVARLHPDGDVDLDWNPGVGPNTQVTRLAISPDGKLYIGGAFTQVSGASRSRIARLNTDGSHDTAFLTGTGLNNMPNAILALPDGRVVVGGAFTSYNNIPAGRLIRIAANGALDDAFNPAPSNTVHAIARYPDGRLLVAGDFTAIGGETRGGLAWLSADGDTLESDFGLTGNYRAVALEDNGGFFALTAQTANQVQRFLADGQRDLAFHAANNYRGNFTAANGTSPSAPTGLLASDNHVLVTGPFIHSGPSTRHGFAWLGVSESLAPVILTPPANIIVAEGGRAQWTVTAVAPAGVITRTWNKVEGADVLSTSGSLVLDDVRLSDGGTYRVLVGNGEGFAEAYFTLSVTPAPGPAPGTLDLEFYAAGMTSVTGIAPAAGGGFWVISSGSIRRINTNGSLDESYAAPAFSGGSVTDITVAPDGRLYAWGTFATLGGHSTGRLARLGPDGAIDTSFTAPFASGTINALAFAPDGGVYVGGNFTGLTVGGKETTHLVRLTETGALDETFDPNGGTSSAVTALQILEDGRLLAGGSFTTAAGAARLGLVRFFPDGSLDTSFNSISVTNILAIALLSDGRILIGGSFTSVDGLSRPRLARLSADGVVDPSFALSGISGNNVRQILPRPDGRIVIGGSLGSNRMVQLLEDGTLDAGFDTGLTFNTVINAALLLPNGNILVGGGNWTLSSGAHRPGLAMIQGSPLHIDPVEQFIVFEPLPDIAFTLGPVMLTASASSGLPVSFDVINGPATAVDNTLLLTGAGTVTVRATQDGNETFLPSDPVERTFMVLATFLSWQLEQFDNLEDPSQTGPTDDFSGDGLSNLMAYALGLDPRLPSTAGRPQLAATSDELVFTYTRPSDRTDLDYAVEASFDLTSWTTDGVTHSHISTTGDVETWRAAYPLEDASNAFLRLKVESR